MWNGEVGVVDSAVDATLPVDVAEPLDPHADSDELKHEYGFGLSKLGKGYDGVIVAVNHKEYRGLDEAYFESILSPKGVLTDVKGLYRRKISKITYWSL